MPFSTGSRIDRYEILSLLGKGGMGEVYLARDTELGRTVALKLLPEELDPGEQRLRRFFQEARTASALNHPNILTIYEFGKFQSKHFIVTEYVEGNTLRGTIAGAPMEWREVLDIAVQIAEALNAAHAAGIIHRDIKPENVMLRKDGYVKVLDFGLAKLTRPKTFEPEAVTLVETDTGIVMGTMSYMSPEQARGLTVDARSDIFSLGIVLYEMLTGKVPFKGSTNSDVLVSILEREPRRITTYSPEVPLALEQIVGKALAKNVADRYQSTQELLVDLKAVRRDPVSSTEAKVSQSRPRRWFIAPSLAIAAAVVILGIVFAAYFLRNRPGPGSQEANVPIALAVLPFRALNEQAEIGFLSIGIPDAIITRLANFQRIRVRPTSAILPYDNQNIDLRAVGLTLAADYLVTGTVQKVGDNLRVGVQLVRVSDGAPIWGQPYDNSRSDLLTLQDAIAGEITTALKIRMTATEQARFYRRYTQEAAAYELYLQGRSSLLRYKLETTLAAIDDFEKALGVDQNYALAHAGLAEACALMRVRFASEAEVKKWEERAKLAARNALALDASLAEAHEALAAVYRSADFDWEKTIHESDQALELNPNLEQPHRTPAETHERLFRVKFAD